MTTSAPLNYSLLLNTLLEAVVSELGITDELTDEEDVETYSAIAEHFSKIVPDDWKELTLNAELGDEERSDSLKVTLRAPSYKIMYDAFNAVTSRQKLSALAANFMPREDGEDDDWDDDYDYDEEED